MNTKTIQQLKQELLDKKGTLSNMQAMNKQTDVERDASLTDVMDRSEVEESWFNKERMSQHWKVELIQIDSALQRIEAGTFGVCEECDDEIPVKRLRVRPDASLCLNCQESAERELGHGHRMVRPSSAPTQFLQ